MITPGITSGSVSVLIPAFNHERYVGAALQSVADQTLTPLDVVVVDDGSQDGTPDVLARRATSGVKVLRQENRGAHAALNRAMAEAQGQYLAILNSDDVFLPRRLEHALGVAVATGAALVLGRVRWIGAEGEDLQSDHPAVVWYREALETRADAASLSDVVKRHNVAVTTSNFFVHRSLWEELGGFRDYRYVHDMDFLLRALALSPRHVEFEDSLCDVGYRLHGANTIQEDTDAALDERTRLVADLSSLSARGAGLFRGPGAGRRITGSIAAWSPRLGISVDAASRPPCRCGIVVSSLDNGGLEEVVALLAEGLPGQGVETQVLCTHGGGAVGRRLARAGVEVTVAEGDPARWTQWLNRVRPDVVSTHFVDIDVAAHLHDAGAVLVETVHNTYAWFDRDGWLREAKKTAFLRGVVAVSETAAEYYQRHLPGEVDFLGVIPNAVHPERLAVVPRGFARRHLDIPPDVPVFVQLGRISVQKNQAALVDAFAIIAEREPRAMLILAGEALEDDGIARRIRSAHPTLLSSGQLRMDGPSTHANVLLSAADVYVSYSLFEGWSVAAGEALWSGLPLVLSTCGGSRELVGEGGQRGTLVPHPLVDPLSVGPHQLEAETVPTSGPSEALVVALGESVRAGPADGRDARREWARSHLDVGTMCSAYARVLRACTGLRQE